ncbi:MAG: amidase [Bacteroidetes bacterium]|nr:amidase [Bacteroidota bacterium]MCW5894779.1 amidase [Bacteroidota bacterium]
MIAEEVLYSPISGLAKFIKRKKLSPVKLTEEYLKRIEKIAPKLNAFVTVTADLALQQARQAEREINSGLYRGPLHGIPYAVKDLFAVRGYPTTWGARPYAGQTIDEDATVIKKLHEAGAILLGKAAMSEIAGGPPTATATGACRTPWDLTRWSGGSSSGSGAAVAAGLCVFALGTETWGSIMTPSSFCGITGLRPTFGRISRAGAMALSWTMDKVGPMCRNVADAATVFSILHGRDAGDAMSVQAPFKFTPNKSRENIMKLRVGFIREDYEKWGEPDVALAFMQALEMFKQLGLDPKEIHLPDHPYETIAATIISAEEASAFEPLVKAGKVSGIIDPDRRGELLGAQLITAVDYLRCQRIRTRISHDVAHLFTQYDIILGSSTLQCAPPIEADMQSIFGGGNTIEAVENLAGLPAVSVPCGFSKTKLPIGLKVIGRPFAESDVLAMAHMFQSVTEWHTKRPRV